jgi:hypothetical protein
MPKQEHAPPVLVQPQQVEFATLYPMMGEIVSGSLDAVKDWQHDHRPLSVADLVST